MKVASIVLDVDSTLCGVEGIDWLAQRRGGDVARRIRELTERAMNGELPLDAVYGERLALIKPSRDDVQELSQVYRRTIAADAAPTIARWLQARRTVVLVSGGIRQAISPLARELGVALEAVDLVWDADGEYQDYDRMSPLTTQQGKHDIIRRLALAQPIVAIGDGSTDIAMKAAASRFIAYTGFVKRQAVMAAADARAESFGELDRLLS